MPREKPYFRDTVNIIQEKIGEEKVLIGVNDIRKYLKCGYDKALEYLDGKDKITIFQFASKLL